MPFFSLGYYHRKKTSSLCGIQRASKTVHTKFVKPKMLSIFNRNNKSGNFVTWRIVLFYFLFRLCAIISWFHGLLCVYRFLFLPLANLRWPFSSHFFMSFCCFCCGQRSSKVAARIKHLFCGSSIHRIVKKNKQTKQNTQKCWGTIIFLAVCDNRTAELYSNGRNLN